MDAKTITHFLLSKGYRVILTYRRNTFFDVEKIRTIFYDDLKKYPDAELYLEVCDISCQNSVNECIRSCLLKHSRIDELYLLAANSHVGESFKNKELSIITNGQSVYYFLEALKNDSPKTRTYFAATSELTGGTGNRGFKEEDAWNPRSPYAIGKALGARWINFYRDSLDSGLFCCSGILFNHSNTYRSKDFIIRKLTNGAAKIALGKLRKLEIGHIHWSRDEHWSDFGCEMMWKMLQLNSPENFVIGNEIDHTGEEYVKLIFDYFNLDWKKHIEFSDKLVRPNEVVNLIADSTKAKKLLGWVPNRIPFKHHIDLMCEFDYNLELKGFAERPNVFNIVTKK